MIEFLCTLAGLIAGVAVTMSFVAAKGEGEQSDLQNVLQQIDAEKMRAVANQLKSLTSRMFSDVNTHSAKMEQFTASINEVTEGSPEWQQSAFVEIIGANAEMQAQLQDARQRIAEQTELIEQATHLARTDSLTGLPNRRALEEYLQSCLESKTNQHLGLLLLDIDRFKSINDSYGHPAGDAVLIAFARKISGACDQQSFAARHGGEEFAIVLIASDEVQLIKKATRIRQAVSANPIVHEDLELVVTASAGLSLVQPGDDLNVAAERSDEGMYQAKRNGRNQGFWLASQGWEPFPDEGEDLDAEQFRAHFGVPTASKSVRTYSPSSDLNTELELLRSEDSGPVTACLDLGTFVERVAEHLDTLQKKGLPAGVIMVEAINEDQVPLNSESWQKVVTVIESKVRGIDLLCLYRPQTICMFLPGCSCAVTHERAADVLLNLNLTLETWELPTVPSRFAVSVGHADENEETTPLLDRLEQALNEAHDASPNEMVIHNGQSTYFQKL
ncbi:MAG: GGDEF domain-containing protein [Pirellulaceae bacterium]|nr:GGDEF domain-containing protein [Pirellulaceae bacterium]